MHVLAIDDFDVDLMQAETNDFCVHMMYPSYRKTIIHAAPAVNKKARAFRPGLQ
jgi:hypothetical protein